MPPSIGLKMSAVICGKSAVVFPAAFASSIGSFFSQPENVRDRTAARQAPSRARAEKIAFGLEERLHRAIIDIPPVNREAREFWKAGNDGSSSSSLVLLLVPRVKKAQSRTTQEDEKSSG